MPPLLFAILVTETENITYYPFRLIAILHKICMIIVTFLSFDRTNRL